MNYLIVLFKNKEKRKIINKFKTSKKALKYYDSLLSDSNNVIFETKTENGLGCSFDLALMEIKGSKSEKTYIKDELGRTKVVETDSEDYNIIKINPFRIEEEFWDYFSKTKIDSPFFEKKYLSKSGIKLISKLNNKVILQNDDNINLFTLKSISDADRFISNFETYCINKGRTDCIFVKDTSFPQKKYLYNLLIEYGFPKSYLQRYSTTHHVKK